VPEELEKTIPSVTTGKDLLKPGSKVKCIKSTEDLELGRTYTIRQIFEQFGGEIYVRLEEFNFGEWYPDRFKLWEGPTPDIPNRLFTKSRMLRFEI